MRFLSKEHTATELVPGIPLNVVRSAGVELVLVEKESVGGGEEKEPIQVVELGPADITTEWWVALGNGSTYIIIMTSKFIVKCSERYFSTLLHYAYP